MKKRVLFVLLEQFADFEVAYLSSAITLIGQGNFEMQMVSLKKEPITSIGALHVLPDYDVQSVPDEYEALVLIGGNTWREPASRQVEPLVHACVKQKRLLAGICDGSAFLATTGVLNHVRHTSNDLDDVKQWAGEAYTGEKYYIRRQAVRDQMIITANGTASMEFAKEVMLALQVASVERIMEWYNFHKLGYYVADLPEM